MQKTVDTILKKYGVDVELQRDREKWTIRGFFQPVDSISWQSIEHGVSPLGYASRAEYLCIAPAEAGIQEAEVLVLGEKQYLAQRVEDYRCCGEAVYQWVLCIEKGGVDTWGA